MVIFPAQDFQPLMCKVLGLQIFQRRKRSGSVNPPLKDSSRIVILTGTDHTPQLFGKACDDVLVQLLSEEKAKG